MTLLDEYEKFVTTRCAPQPDQAAYLTKGALGVCSEAGEIAGSIEKHVHQGHELDWGALVLELGDLLWYLTLLAHHIGMGLDEIILSNMNKLNQRYTSGIFNVEESIERRDV